MKTIGSRKKLVISFLIIVLLFVVKDNLLSFFCKEKYVVEERMHINKYSSVFAFPNPSVEDLDSGAVIKILSSGRSKDGNAYYFVSYKDHKFGYIFNKNSIKKLK